MVYVEQTSTAFAKIDMKQPAQEHLFFKLPLVSLKQIEKFLQFSFKTVENFSNSKPQHGERKLGENSTPRAVRTCDSPGGRPEGGGEARN